MVWQSASEGMDFIIKACLFSLYLCPSRPRCERFASSFYFFSFVCRFLGDKLKPRPRRGEQKEVDAKEREFESK